MLCLYRTTIIQGGFMKTFIFTLTIVLSFTSLQSYSVKQGSTAGRMGSAMGQALNEYYDQQASYNRQIQYQRAMMQMQREQIMWEMEMERQRNEE
jgi:hypothetical protein